MWEGKKRHLKCSGVENPVTLTGAVREARKVGGDPRFPMHQKGLKDCRHTSVPGFWGSWPGLLLPGNATGAVAKMKDTATSCCCFLPRMLSWLPTVCCFSCVGTAFSTG